MEQLKALLGKDVNEVKDQVEELKNQFYRVYRQEQEAARKKAEELGENMAEYKPVVDEIEQNFRQLFSIYKQKRAEASAKREAEMQQNLLRKQNILEQMKQLAESETADVTANLQKMRDLQAEWKTIGPVPAPQTAALWKEYQHYGEQFYDLVKINFELREYDFKKNLQEKTALCEQAEALADNPDIVAANRTLQQLHEDWANIGPVARDIREQLWDRFKAASTVINKRHQEYFDKIHAKEEENLQKKQALIDQAAQIDVDSLKSNKQWDEATEKIQALQAEWRTIGFAPKKQNQTIYDDFRAITDKFYSAKTAFYKDLRDEMNANLRQKKDLLRQAEELKDSTDWQATTEKLIELQKQWKQVGPVARKYSEEIWKQFTAACDHFFDEKKKAYKADHEAYLKRQEERKAGHAREEELSGDRRKLVRMYEAIQLETKTMENNMGFFSGKAEGLLKTMQKKIEANKQKMAEIEAKIAEIDAADAAGTAE